MSEEREYTRRKPPELREGTITRIAPQRRDDSRVSIYLDGEFIFGLSVDVMQLYALEKGQFLPYEKVLTLVEEDQLKKAKATALEFISYRGRSEKEVRDKLEKKSFSPEIIEKAVSRFEDLGYINDETYARDYARSRLQGKGYGPQRIRMDLKKRGVPKHLIEEALQELDEADSYYEIALREGRKRWQRLAKETDPYKRKKKLGDFLLRKGYNYDVVRQVMDRLERGDEEF